MILKVLNGQKVLVFYSMNLLSQYESVDKSSVLTWCIGMVLVVTAICAGHLVQLLGRRQLVLFGQALSSLVLFCLTCAAYAHYYHFIKYLLILFVLFFSSSIGSVLWLYLPEILPSTHLAYCSLIYWASTVLVGLIYPFIKVYYGLTYVFLFFFLASLLSLFVIYFFMLETKNKSYQLVCTQYRILFANLSINNK